MPHKNKEKKKTEPLFGWTKFFFVLACIAFIAVVFYLIGPYAMIIPILLGFFLMVFQGVFIVFTTVFSAGYIWKNEGYKTFNDGWYQLWDTLFSTEDVLTPILKSSYIYCFQIVGVIFAIALIFSILSLIFYKKKSLGLFIALLVLILVAVVLGYFIIKQFAFFG